MIIDFLILGKLIGAGLATISLAGAGAGIGIIFANKFFYTALLAVCVYFLTEFMQELRVFEMRSTLGLQEII